MNIYSFDVVISTHDHLKRGHVAVRLRGSQHGHHRVVVLAEDEFEAWAIACQMASCQGIVTKTYDRV